MWRSGYLLAGILWHGVEKGFLRSPLIKQIYHLTPSQRKSLAAFLDSMITKWTSSFLHSFCRQRHLKFPEASPVFNTTGLQNFLCQLFHLRFQFLNFPALMPLLSVHIADRLDCTITMHILRILANSIIAWYCLKNTRYLGRFAFRSLIYPIGWSGIQSTQWSRFPEGLPGRCRTSSRTLICQWFSLSCRLWGRTWLSHPKRGWAPVWIGLPAIRPTGRTMAGIYRPVLQSPSQTYPQPPNRIRYPWYTCSLNSNFIFILSCYRTCFFTAYDTIHFVSLQDILSFRILVKGVGSYAQNHWWREE